MGGGYQDLQVASPSQHPPCFLWQQLLSKLEKPKKEMKGRFRQEQTVIWGRHVFPSSSHLMIRFTNLSCRDGEHVVWLILLDSISHLMRAGGGCSPKTPRRAHFPHQHPTSSKGSSCFWSLPLHSQPMGNRHAGRNLSQMNFPGLLFSLSDIFLDAYWDFIWSK